MLRKAIVSAMTGAMFLVAACEQSDLVSPSGSSPVLSNTPASGSGNKQVFTVNENSVITCPNGQTLNRQIEGWFQVQILEGSGNRNVELYVHHLVRTYSNSQGDTYVFREVGPHRYYLDEEGNLIIALSGRSAAGVIGHLLVNLTTGEVELIAGQEFGAPGFVACDALT
jgi:hypothetical protein